MSNITHLTQNDKISTENTLFVIQCFVITECILIFECFMANITSFSDCRVMLIPNVPASRRTTAKVLSTLMAGVGGA